MNDKTDETVNAETSNKADNVKAVEKRIRVISNFMFVLVGHALITIVVVFDVPYEIGKKVLNRFFEIN